MTLTDWASLTPEQKQEMKRAARAAAITRGDFRGKRSDQGKHTFVDNGVMDGPRSHRCEEGDHSWCARLLTCTCFCHSRSTD